MAEYIDRRTALDALYDADAITYEGLDILENIPAAVVQPVKHGRWITAERRGIVSYTACYAECSACHDKPVFSGWEMRYCPNCGAKMEVEHDL